MNTMERILRLMAERKASDIYLSANSPALIRINGNCMPINAQVLPPEAPLSLLSEVVHESRCKRPSHGDTRGLLNAGKLIGQNGEAGLGIEI